MVDEKNHLFSPIDMLKDGKTVNKRKTQQQFSRFSTSLALTANNATIQASSPAIQPGYKPQIGFPYDDTLGSLSADVEISFQVDGTQYTFMEVTTDTAITFSGLPPGRFIEFSVHIEVNQAAGVAITFPQVTNPPTLAGNDDDIYVLKFVGVKRSDVTGVNPPVETYTFLAGTDSSTGGGGCPIICIENSLGDVTGIVDLDWSLANFHRAVLTGDTTFNIINTPGNTLWQDICLEVQQDEVGGHSVGFVQGFANSFIPVAIQGAGRYTSWQIYTYEEPSGTDIFQGFDKSGNNGPSVPGGGGLFQGFAGYIQAVLSLDQTTNIGINDHIEFDTILSNDTITVSVGTGQANGIFSGFRPGHTYECEVHVGVLGSSAALNFACQWFDITENAFIGTQSQSISVRSNQQRNFQPVGKAMFQAVSLADTLEVRIKDSTALTNISNGSSSTEPETFVTIKDCGVIEEIINQPEPAPEDGELDIREFMYGQAETNSILKRYARFQNNINFNDLNFIGFPLIRNIRIKNLIINVTSKGANDRSFNLEVDDVPRGPLFIIPGGFTGILEFQPLDIAIDKDELVGWSSVGGTAVTDMWTMQWIVWYL